MSGDDRFPDGELDQAERFMWDPGANGQAAEQLATNHAQITGPDHDGVHSTTAAARAATGVRQTPAEREAADDLGLFGPDRPEPDDIRAGEDASASAWADGEAEWPPSDPWARRGLHNLVSRMAEAIGREPEEMVKVRAGDLDNALLVAVSALHEADRRMEATQQAGPYGRKRLCAHADQDGRGMHRLEPGQICPPSAERSGNGLPFLTSPERSAERGDFEAG